MHSLRQPQSEDSNKSQSLSQVLHFSHKGIEKWASCSSALSSQHCSRRRAANRRRVNATSDASLAQRGAIFERNCFPNFPLARRYV